MHRLPQNDDGAPTCVGLQSIVPNNKTALEVSPSSNLAGSPSPSDTAGEAFLWVIFRREVNGISPATHWQVAATEHLQGELF